MFQKKKYSLLIEILVLLPVLLTLNVVFVVEASFESNKGQSSVHNNEILKDKSSNEISAKEKDSEPENEQLYYLPMQATFTETHTLGGVGGVFTTSPPHLSINPAPIKTSYLESSSVFDEDPVVHKLYSEPYQSQCVSETPAHELESRFLLPSRDVVKESVIIAGHVEVASKTSSEEKITEINNIVSKPSIALQGTLLHSHTVSDL